MTWTSKSQSLIESQKGPVVIHRAFLFAEPIVTMGPKTAADEMRHPDRSLNTIGDLIAALRAYGGRPNEYWFRGQADANWPLIPIIARNAGHLAAELTLIKTFRQNARAHITNVPVTDWEWAFLMQHHRAPTRLLDWSESPLVALYFAVAEDLAQDAALWVLDPVALNRHSGHRRAFARDILAFDIDADLDQYLPDQVNAKKTDLFPVAAIGPRNSPRMVAQAGTFTIMHASAYAVEAVADSSHVWRLIIPAASKPPLREELAMLGINEHSLFPDLDRVAGIAKGLLA